MLTNNAMLLFELLQRNCIFQQDGTAPDVASCVRDYMIIKLPNNWIWTAGPASLAPHVPILIQEEFPTWKDFKFNIFSLPVHFTDALNVSRRKIKRIQRKIIEKQCEISPKCVYILFRR